MEAWHEILSLTGTGVRIYIKETKTQKEKKRHSKEDAWSSTIMRMLLICLFIVNTKNTAQRKAGPKLQVVNPTQMKGTSSYCKRISRALHLCSLGLPGTWMEVSRRRIWLQITDWQALKKFSALLQHDFVPFRSIILKYSGFDSHLPNPCAINTIKLFLFFWISSPLF